MSKRPKNSPIAALLLLLGVLLSMPLLSLQQDSSLLRWLPQDSPAMVALNTLRDRYGIQEVMVISQPESGTVSDRMIPGAKLVLSQTLALESVEETVELRKHPFFGPLLFRPGLKLTFYEVEDPEQLPDFASLKLGPEEGFFSESYLNHAIDQTAKNSAAPWFFLFGLISLLLLSWIYRSVKTALGFMLLTTPGIMVALAIHQTCYGPLYPISLMSPPIIFLLTLTAALHRCEALKANPETSWRPTILALGTSASSFYSLTASSITPAIALGFSTGSGILFNLLSLKVLLPLLPIPKRTSTNVTNLTALTKFLTRYGKVGALIMMATFALSLLQMHHLTFASQPLPMLPYNNLYRVHAQLLEDHGGFIPMTLVLPDFHNRSWEKFQELEASFDGLESLASIHGAMQWIRLASLNVFQQWEIPQAQDDLSLILDELAHTDSPSSNFLSANHLRFELQWNPQYRSKISTDLHTLQSRLQMLGYHPVIGGLSRIAIDMDQEMLTLFTRCFPLTACLIFLALLLSGSGLRDAVVALIPNLLPITVILAVQAWLEYPMDIAGSLMGAVLMGIAVDDTLHILESYRNHGPLYFIQYGLRPVLLTSLILIAGFSGFSLAPFGPIRQFGLYLCVGSLIAVVSDVFGFSGWLLWRKTSVTDPLE